MISVKLGTSSVRCVRLFDNVHKHNDKNIIVITKNNVLHNIKSMPYSISLHQNLSNNKKQQPLINNNQLEYLRLCSLLSDQKVHQSIDFRPCSTIYYHFFSSIPNYQNATNSSNLDDNNKIEDDLVTQTVSNLLLLKNSNNPILNAFEIFGLPTHFKINKEQLKRTYRILMKDLHPDRFQHNNDTNHQEQNNNNDQIANEINAAYDILKKPHTRSTLLLEILGIPLQEKEDGAKLVGMEFLMEIMSYREEIDEIIISLADDEEKLNKNKALQQLLDDSEVRIEDICIRLEHLLSYNENENEQKDIINIQKDALQFTAQLQYWNRIHETIREHMEI